MGSAMSNADDFTRMRRQLETHQARMRAAIPPRLLYLDEAARRGASIERQLRPMRGLDVPRSNEHRIVAGTSEDRDHIIRFASCGGGALRTIGLFGSLAGPLFSVSRCDPFSSMP